MNKIPKIIGAVFLVILIWASYTGAYEIKNIDLSKIGNMTIATIYADGKIDFTHKIISEAPIRVVVDFRNARHALPNKDYFSLPSATLKSIRTSQCSLDPLITRVVFDIGKPITYTVRDEGDKLVLSFPTPNDPEFSPWAATVPMIERHAKAPADTAERKTEIKRVVRKEGKPAPEPTAEEASDQVEKLATPTPSISSKWIELETAYQRELIAYRSGETRDPFASLIETKKAGKAFGETVLPAVEELILVGVLQGDDVNIALCQDGHGNGFMFKPGDKIKNGWVSEVTKETAYFRVSEFGWTRTVGIRLQNTITE